NVVYRTVRFGSRIRYHDPVEEAGAIIISASDTGGALSVASSVCTTVGGCASDIRNHDNARCALIDNQGSLAGGRASKLIRHRQFVTAGVTGPGIVNHQR